VFSLLRCARSVLHRVAPDWHPSRLAPVRRAIAAWVGWRRPPILTTKHGFELCVPPDDRSPIVVSLYLHGEYEPEETRAIQRWLREGDVAVDVGANVGYMTGVMARAVGATGAVHSFEPETSHFAALEENVKRNHLEQVICRRKALSTAAGTMSLYLDRENPGDHTLVPIPGRESVSIETLAFDDYWNQVSDQRCIRLVKIDVQGHEPSVLQGMRKTLGAGLIRAILIEVWPHRLEEANSSANALLDLLAALEWNVTVLSTTAPERPTTLAEIRVVAESKTNDPHLAFNILLTASE